MIKQGYIRLGKVLKTHGIKGELQISLDIDDVDAVEDLKVLFIDINKNLIPYFIENIRIGGQKAIVALQDIPTVEKAAWLCGKVVFADEKMLPERQQESFRPEQLIGYGVTDLKHGYIGLITQLLELRGHSLLQIDSDGKEVLIPYRDEIIQSVDEQHKTLHIEAPEGLIELYL